MSDNEAKLIVETEIPIAMACADGTAIPKGTLVKLADPFTVSLAAATGDFIGGITGSEKIANDGMLNVDVYRRGIFRVHASGGITAGDAVTSANEAPNHVIVTNNIANMSGSKIAGIALETVGDAGTLLIDLNIQCISNS